MPTFGKKASQYEQEREDSNDEVWIKGFKEGETRIRFLDDPDDFVTFREHFEEAIGFFPCSEEGDCVGCKDDSAKVRDRSRKFAFHALNTENSQQIYKVGSRLHRQLKSKAQRLGTITDRDYTVIRSGKGMQDTTYDLESGDKYETSYDPKSEPPYDIGAILAAKYADAVEAYTGERPEDAPKVTWHATPAGDDEPRSESNGSKKTSTAKEEPKAEAKSEPKEEAKSEEKGEEKSSGDEAQAETASGSYPNPADMTRQDLADWLTNPPKGKAVEFPTNAPRSRLVKMVTEHQKANPPF